MSLILSSQVLNVLFWIDPVVLHYMWSRYTRSRKHWQHMGNSKVSIQALHLPLKCISLEEHQRSFINVINLALQCPCASMMANRGQTTPRTPRANNSEICRPCLTEAHVIDSWREIFITWAAGGKGQSLVSRIDFETLSQIISPNKPRRIDSHQTFK